MKHNYLIVVVMITMKTDCSLQWELMATYVIKGDFPKEVMLNTDIKFVSVQTILRLYVCTWCMSICVCVCVCSERGCMGEWERKREMNEEKYEGADFGM